MSWMLIYFSLEYSGALNVIEFPSEKECLTAKQQLERSVGAIRGNRVLTCVKRGPKYNVPDHR